MKFKSHRQRKAAMARMKGRNIRGPKLKRRKKDFFDVLFGASDIIGKKLEKTAKKQAMKDEQNRKKRLIEEAKQKREEDKKEALQKKEFAKQIIKARIALEKSQKRAEEIQHKKALREAEQQRRKNISGYSSKAGLLLGSQKSKVKSRPKGVATITYRGAGLSF